MSIRKTNFMAIHKAIYMYLTQIPLCVEQNQEQKYSDIKLTASPSHCEVI